MAQEAQNYGAGAGWFDPAFASYGPALAGKMTEWLYGDANNNPAAFDNRSLWNRAGRVAFVDRTVLVTGVVAAATSVTNANLGGGKNVIVFARVASLTVSTEVNTGAVLRTLLADNQLYGAVTCQIQRQSGFIDTDTAPLCNIFGTAQRPNIRPIPELWLGNELRTFTLVNNLTAGTINVSLTFLIAFLDTGR